jgi:tetratricopeptide (TPR) repeat protein
MPASRISHAAALTLVVTAALAAAPAHGQSVLLDEVHTIAAPTTGVPIEHSFTISQAGTYQVTLTDLGASLTPSAPLAAVKLAMTSGNALVGNPLIGAGTLTLSNLASGTYELHVVGTPGTTPGSGPVGITVTASNMTQVAAFEDVIALPNSALPNGEAVLDDSFTVSANGSYSVSLDDLALPQSLQTLTLLLIAQGGATPLLTLPSNGVFQSSVTLTAGVTYRILAVGQAATGASGGLYSAVVTSGGSGGAVAYGHAVPVGGTLHLGSPALAAGGYTLSLADLAFPEALTQVGAVLLLNGQSVAGAKLAAAGSSNFTAGAGTYEAYAAAGPAAAAPGAGSYALRVLPQGGGAPAFAVARGVTASGSALTAVAFDTTVPAAGPETVSLADFQFPVALSSVLLGAVQGGALEGTPLSAPGSFSITATSGPLSLVAFAAAGTGTAGGLFGVELVPGGGGTPLFDATQAVGALFYAERITVTAAGAYAVTATDLGFPASFTTYDTIVTQGTMPVGSIYGGGTFNFTATPGDYFVNFIAQPTGSDQAGTYGLTVAAAPPAPVVSLSVDNPSVTSGSTVDIIWSSQNATSCTASGGWSGTQALSGTTTSAVLTTNTTFTLTCTGAGGTASKSVSVSVTPAGKGGGGALDATLLAVLGVLLAARRKAPISPASRRALALALAILASAFALSGCGGAQSRFAAHMQRGREFFSAGDFQRASIEFRNAIQIAPKDPQARIMAGETAEKLGRWRDAGGLYQSVVDSHPENTRARTDLGRLYDFGGAPDRALKVVEPALAKTPNDAELLAVRAMARSQLNDLKGARDDAEHAVQIDPSNEDAVALLSALDVRDDERGRAVQLVSAAVAKRPASADLREVLVNIYLGGDDFANAEQQLRSLIALEPARLSYRYQLALLLRRTHEINDAQKVLEDAVSALPHSSEAKVALVDFIAAERSRAAAEDTLQRLISREPDNYDLRLDLGALLQRAGSTQQAIEAYNQVISRDEDGPSGLIARDRIATIYAAQGRAADAEKLVREVLQKSPQDNDALVIRANIALSRKDPATAITDLRTVLRDQPDSVGVRRGLARAYLADGNPTLAEEQLQTALNGAPKDAGVRLDLAELYLNTQRAGQAVPLLEQAVTASPNDGLLREALVRAYLADKNLPAARTAAQELTTLQPRSAVGPYLAGVVAQAQNRLDDAESDYQTALQLQASAFMPLASLVRLEASRGESAKAVAYLQGMIAVNPKDAMALEMLGEVYIATRRYPQAVGVLTQAVAAAPKWWYGYRNLAVARAGSNDLGGAVAAYQAGLAAAPDEPQLVVEFASYYESKGRIDDAISLYERFYARNPRSRLAANNLALMLATYRTDRASLDRARDLTEGFLSSNDGELLDTSGWVRFKRGELQAALPVLERAVARAPDSRLIHYHLGMAELRAGQRARARANLEAAVSGSASFPGADDARTALAGLKSGAG